MAGGFLSPTHRKGTEFPETEKYFTDAELEAMLKDFWEFDKNMIHGEVQEILESITSEGGRMNHQYRLAPRRWMGMQGDLSRFSGFAGCGVRTGQNRRQF